MTKLASDLAPEDHIDAFVARECGKFLERFRNEPFFLVAGFLKPHAPYHPPKGWADELYPPARMGLRSVGDGSGYRYLQKQIEAHQSRGNDTLRFRRAGQLGCLAFLDQCVGQVYRELEELGLLKNTIVVYTSDHGEMDGDHGLYEKGVFFEPSVGVPLIVSQPGTLPEGIVAKGLVEYFALYPTLAELTGTTSTSLQGLEARSFAAQLCEPGAPGAQAAYSEIGPPGAGRFMIRTPEFKYILNQDDIPELYDLDGDPGETKNLAAEAKYRIVRDKLRDQLLAWHHP
jgi:choline-sulfatase